MESGIDTDGIETLLSYYVRDHVTKDWRKLLQWILDNPLPMDEQRKYLWSWPREEDLQQLGNVLKAIGVSRVLSVGCGNGLFEWLLQESLKLEVYGLEVDRNWWQSPYSVKPFINNIHYLEEILSTNANANEGGKEEKGGFLQECCCGQSSHPNDWNFALMFSYFNDYKAFLRYLRLYGGSWLLLIGPVLNNVAAAVYSEPLPLQEDFQEMTERAGAGQWSLHSKLPIGFHSVLALYRRHTSDSE